MCCKMVIFLRIEKKVVKNRQSYETLPHSQLCVIGSYFCPYILCSKSHIAFSIKPF